MSNLQPTTIVYPNTKGQITIPKNLRDQLAIDSTTPLAPQKKGNQLIFTPIESLKPKLEPWSDKRVKLKAALDATRGIWSEADYHQWQKMRQKRRKVELAASSRRKKAW